MIEQNRRGRRELIADVLKDHWPAPWHGSPRQHAQVEALTHELESALRRNESIKKAAQLHTETSSKLSQQIICDCLDCCG